MAVLFDQIVFSYKESFKLTTVARFLPASSSLSEAGKDPCEEFKENPVY